MLKNVKDLSMILLSEGLVVVAVIWTFTNVQPLRLAALIAAALFLFLGILIVVRVRLFKKSWSYFSLWNGWIHLLIFTIPLLLMRLIYWEANFSDIEVFGLKAATLHLYSTPFYKWMVFGTVFDIGRELFFFYRYRRATK